MAAQAGAGLGSSGSVGRAPLGCTSSWPPSILCVEPGAHDLAPPRGSRCRWEAQSALSLVWGARGAYPVSDQDCREEEESSKNTDRVKARFTELLGDAGPAGAGEVRARVLGTLPAPPERERPWTGFASSCGLDPAPCWPAVTAPALFHGDRSLVCPDSSHARLSILVEGQRHRPLPVSQGSRCTVPRGSLLVCVRVTGSGWRCVRGGAVAGFGISLQSRCWELGASVPRLCSWCAGFSEKPWAESIPSGCARHVRVCGWLWRRRTSGLGRTGLLYRVGGSFLHRGLLRCW